MCIRPCSHSFSGSWGVWRFDDLRVVLEMEQSWTSVVRFVIYLTIEFSPKLSLWSAFFQSVLCEITIHKDVFWLYFLNLLGFLLFFLLFIYFFVVVVFHSALQWGFLEGNVTMSYCEKKATSLI